MSTTTPSPALDSDLADPVRGNSSPDTVWTTANVGEAAPAVMTPLCWSLWGPGNELAARESLYRCGTLGPEDVFVDPDQDNRILGVFFGRQAMSVNLCRALFDRFPGMTGDDWELGLTGRLIQDPKPLTPLTERQEALVAATVDRLRHDHDDRLRALADEQTSWWTNTVLPTERSGEPITRLVESFDRFVASHSLHIDTRMLGLATLKVVFGQVAAADALHLMPAITSAFGGVQELDMAADIWSLAREEITREEFIRRHGYHGDTVGNPASTSWRENPDLLTPVLSALRGRGAADSPDQRARRAAGAKAEALADVESKLDAEQVEQLRTALEIHSQSVRQTEIGKAAYLQAIDGYRAAARDLGRQLVDDGQIDEVDDVFMYTLAELREDRGASITRPEIALRKQRVEEYRGITLPVHFTGLPEPIAVGGERAQVGDVLRGVGASGPTHEGRVRVVLNPDDRDDLEPGDVLVCEATDPAWTVLFLLADAVVVDIGSMGSHAAIVARELGLPAVVDTTDGSRRLRDGDRVRVDGIAGTVTVLEVAE